MLEEIKREHTVLKRFIIKRGLYEALLNDDEFIEHLNTEYPIEPDYKSAWNELKKVIWKLVDDEKREDKFWAKRELKNNIDNSMQELEQKYKLGGE